MYPKLKFLGGFDDAKASNAEAQGGCGGVLVEFEDGRCYEIAFESIDMLGSMLARRVKDQNIHFFAEPGMIVLEKVTLKNMRIAAKELASQGEFGFFTYLKEWDPEKEKRYHKRYEAGMPQLTYEYPTALEEE